MCNVVSLRMLVDHQMVHSWRLERDSAAPDDPGAVVCFVGDEHLDWWVQVFAKLGFSLVDESCLSPACPRCARVRSIMVSP